MAKREKGDEPGNGRLNGWGKVIFGGVVSMLGVTIAIGGPAVYHYGGLSATMSNTCDRVTVLEGERPVLVRIQTGLAGLTEKVSGVENQLKELNAQMKGRPLSWHLRRAEVERAARNEPGGGQGDEIVDGGGE